MNNTAMTELSDRLPVVKAWIGVGVLVFGLMMLLGVVMRVSQGALFGELSSQLFYEIMTLHGAGMVGAAGMAGLAINWFFLGEHVVLRSKVLWWSLFLALVAVAMIIGSILIGHFAAGWTFLYPLPAQSLGVWGSGSAAVFVGGLLLLGVAFLLTYLDMGLAIIKRYGNLGHALGLSMLFGRRPLDENHPPAVVAASMVLIVNGVGIAAGAVVLVMTLANLWQPELLLDALLMKNLIYFFGHVFINASIYAAVTAVYALLPKYVGRPWKVSKPFLAAWAAATLMVMAVYPHHLMMDMVMPAWMLVMGQVVSYTSGLPVLVVTCFSGLLLVYRSGIRWDACSALLVLGLFGWAVGVVPAIVDGVIRANMVLHNTLWVPGHFHIYLLIGLLPMVLGFAYYLVSDGKKGTFGVKVVAVYGVSAFILCLSFLLSGASSVPRRFASYIDSWQWLASVGAIGGAVVLLATMFMAMQLLIRLPRAQWKEC